MRTDDSLRAGGERFERIRLGFEALGELLTNDQLLDLADTCHAILRLRREQATPREARTFARS